MEVEAIEGATAFPDGSPEPANRQLDRINELYNGDIFTEESSQIARGRVHWMCSQCAGDTVLDVGCSQGIAAILLAREGFRTTGLDVIPAAIEYAKYAAAQEPSSVQNRLTWAEGDLASFPAEERFDTVLLGEVVEHQSRPDRFVQLAAKYVQPEGRIVLTTPFGLHPHPDHKATLFPSGIVNMAQRAGLHVDFIDVRDGYIRAVLTHAPHLSQSVEPSQNDVLALTESGAFEAQRRLFQRLDQRKSSLKARETAFRALQQRFAEQVRAHKESVAAHKESIAEHARKLRETQALLNAAQADHAKQVRNLENLLKTAQADHAKQINLLNVAQADHARQVRNLENLLKTAQADHAKQVNLLNVAQADHAKQVRNLDNLLTSQRNRFKAELELVRAEKEAGEQVIAELRSEVTHLRSSAKALRSTISFRLGQLLIHSPKAPRDLARLPGSLWQLRREAVARRRLAASDTPGLARQASLPTRAPSDNAVKPARLREREPSRPVGTEELLSVYAMGGIDAVIGEVKARTRGEPAQVAQALTKAGKFLAESGLPDVTYPIAQAAAQLDRSEPILRTLLWAAGSAKDLEVAYSTMEELDAIYDGSPNPEHAAKLDKLRRIPVAQLSMLKLVPPKAVSSNSIVEGRLCYVLHNSRPFSSGGYSTRAHGVASGLKEAGFEVLTMTRPGYPLDTVQGLTEVDVPLLQEIDGLTYQRILAPARKGSPILYVAQAADAFETRFREMAPEVVMAASNYQTALPALIAARRCGIPFVYEIRGFWEVTRMSRDPAFMESLQYRVMAKLEAEVAKRAEHVFTLTEQMREELISRGTPREKIDLLPNSCDPSRFRPLVRNESLATRLSIPEGVPVLGYVGTFVDYEGLEDLAQACGYLKRQGTEFRLLLVGNENVASNERGPIMQQILDAASGAAFEDWLIMPGRVPHEDVEDYYSLIDICPFPRKPWPVCEMVSPMKPLEAMASEKAVLVSSVEALAGMVSNGETGLTFEKGNIHDMVEKLNILLRDPELRSKLGKQGRAWVERERTWTRVGQIAFPILNSLRVPERRTQMGLSGRMA